MATDISATSTCIAYATARVTEVTKQWKGKKKSGICVWAQSTLEARHFCPKIYV